MEARRREARSGNAPARGHLRGRDGAARLRPRPRPLLLVLVPSVPGAACLGPSGLLSRVPPHSPKSVLGLAGGELPQDVPPPLLFPAGLPDLHPSPHWSEGPAWAWSTSTLEYGNPRRT
jgi:hypothetical protein